MAKASRPAAVANTTRVRTQPPRYDDQAYSDGEHDEVPPEEYVPVELSSDRPQEQQERIPLFTLDGEEYSAPARVPAKVALNAIRLARRAGWADAIWFVIEQSVGEDVIDLLAEHATQEELDAILTRLRQQYLGQMEDMGKGSSSRASRRSRG